MTEDAVLPSIAQDVFEQAAAIVTKHALEMGQESRPGGKEGLVPRPLGQFSADLMFPEGYTKPALPLPPLCTQPWLSHWC